VIELLRRMHRWAEDRLRGPRARLVAAVLCVAAVAAAAWPAWSVAQSLSAQRSGILSALGRASAADRDPSAMQLLEARTVSANGRTYGGPRLISRPIDLFDEDGRMSPESREDLAWRLVAEQVPPWLPSFLARSPVQVAILAVVLATVLALVAWSGILVPAAEIGVPVLALAAGLWVAGFPSATQWTVAAALSFLLFVLLWRAARALLAFRSGVVAVASNTVIEGIRSMAAPGFALPVAMLLPVLVLSRAPQDPLYQAIPGFLDWGHTAVFAFSAVFVLFFGCATTAFEMRDRQVWSVVTKPVSPAGWMVGKWVGTLVLGLATALGGMILLGIGAHVLAAQAPLDEQDARDVRNGVLVARSGTAPSYEILAPERLREMVDQAIEADAVLRADLANGTQDEAAVRRALATERQKEFLDQQRRIGPGDSREFTFAGLAPAVRAGLPVALRFKLHGGGDDEHQRFTTMFQFTTGEGAGAWETREWTPGDPYTFRIDPRFIGDDGTFRVRIWNAGFDEVAKQPVPNPITVFIQPDSLEVMVTESTFERNLGRALLVDACKLAFLSALAVVAGSILSFPIAVLLAFGVFLMASLAPFLSQALEHQSVDDKLGWLAKGFQHAILGVATAVEWAFRSFGERSPSDSLAQGRAIAIPALVSAVAGIGVLWTGAVLAVGWVAMRRKEVAVYSGQG